MNLFSHAIKKAPVAEVVERELPVLYRVAKRMSGSDADAEDLVGQTIVLAFQHWDNFDGRHARSWLIRILRNEWLQVLRKRKVRKEVSSELSEEVSDEGFWRAVDHKMEAELIIQALDHLPEEYRITIALCDVEEMSYEDAAKSLDIPIGTVRSRLFRGRKLLRSRLVSLAPG